MKPRTRNLLLLTPLLLAGLAWIVLLALSHSNSATRWAVERAIGELDGLVSVGAVEGSLAGGVTLEGLRIAPDGMVVEIGRVRAQLEFDLLPPAVHLRGLDGAPVTVRLAGAADTATAKIDLSERLPTLQLPLPLAVENLRLSDIRILDEQGVPITRLDELELEGRWQRTIEDLKLVLRGPEFNAQLTGRAALDAPFSHELRLTGAAPGLDAIALDVSGDEKRTQLALDSPEAWLRGQGSIEQPLEPGEAALHITMASLDIPGEPGVLATLHGLSVDLQGALQDYRVTANARLDGFGLQGAPIHLVADGNLDGLQVQRFDVRAPGQAADAVGSVSWSGGWTLGLDVRVDQASPDTWWPDWPADTPVAGTLRLDWNDARLVLEDLDLQLVGAPLAVSGACSLDFGAELLSARLAWRELHWPLDGVSPQVSSAEGDISLEGRVDDWSARAVFDLQTPDYPGGAFDLEARGGRSSARIEVLSGQALGGDLDAQGSLNWQGALSWRADVRFTDVDLAALWADAPARISGAVRLQQEGADGRFLVDLEQVQGIYKGNAFTARGGLEAGDDGLSFRGVRMDSVASRLLLDGRLDHPRGLQFDVSAQPPGLLYRVLGGRVEGSGRYSTIAPVLDLDLEAWDLAYDGLSIAHLKAAPAQLPGRGPVGLQLDAEDIQVGDVLFEALSLGVLGTMEQQVFELGLAFDEARVGARLEGALSDWSDPVSGWSGRLAGLQMHWRGEQVAELEEPVEADISPHRWRMGRLCLALPQDGRVCSAGRGHVGESFAFETELRTVPLSLSRLVYEHDLDFTQALDGEFQWTQTTGRRPTGRAAIRITAGQFGEVDDPDARMTTEEGFIGFEMENGELVAGQFDVPLPGVGSVDIDFAISGVALDGSGQVDGRASITLERLDALGVLSANLDRVEGRFNAQLDVTGTLAEPSLVGSLSLADGAFVYPYLGTRVSELTLNGSVDRRDHLNLDGQFRVGEGMGTLGVDLDFADMLRPIIDIAVTGDGLGLAELPDVSIVADADVRAGLSGGTLSLDGLVTIPRADIRPLTSMTARATESNDSIIVAGEIPGKTQQQRTEDVSIEGGLRIELGNSVNFHMDTARLNLTGGLDLSWETAPVPLGDGVINLNGEVRAFGPVLRVTNGQVRFPHVPVTNPVLDLRAERDIFGNTQIQSAGVALRGPLRRPDVEAYTQPLTTRERAWGLLLTGTDFDQGQGINALDVGTYIAPRLYISYGLSLFDNENVVGLRYDLKKGWGVKATSGERETGIDMSYTVDR